MRLYPHVFINIALMFIQRYEEYIGTPPLPTPNYSFDSRLLLNLKLMVFYLACKQDLPRDSPAKACTDNQLVF